MTDTNIKHHQPTYINLGYWSHPPIEIKIGWYKKHAFRSSESKVQRRQLTSTCILWAHQWPTSAASPPLLPMHAFTDGWRESNWQSYNPLLIPSDYMALYKLNIWVSQFPLNWRRPQIIYSNSCWWRERGTVRLFTLNQDSRSSCSEGHKLEYSRHWLVDAVLAIWLVERCWGLEFGVRLCGICAMLMMIE